MILALRILHFEDLSVGMTEYGRVYTTRRKTQEAYLIP
jgi:hypothetical protein